MKITVTFHKSDDTSTEMRNMIEGVCLTTDEAETAEWTKIDGHVVLTYRSNENFVSDLIKMWEDEGFNIYEFHSFTISP